jgi:hypothetical protein
MTTLSNVDFFLTKDAALKYINGESSTNLTIINGDSLRVSVFLCTFADE